MFLHDTGSILPFHLLFNMMVLWMFGNEIEELWGFRRFLTFYLLCGIGSGIFSVYNLFNPQLSHTMVIGASGAVLGVMTVYAHYYPDRQVSLFFVIPINIRVLIIAYAVISLLFTLTPRPVVGMISHLTHLGGILVAICYVKLYPLVMDWNQSILSMRSEKKIRAQVGKNIADKKFFEEQIDPILAKISREGMESLTPKERDLLKKAALQNKQKLKSGKIVPLDPFR
jgi:hypothetical protein